jgi:hypothetical protein
MFQYTFRRIVVDEAHAIKNSKSQRSTSIGKLLANFRWLVTGIKSSGICLITVGTPVSKKNAAILEEFNSLISFLQKDVGNSKLNFRNRANFMLVLKKTDPALGLISEDGLKGNFNLLFY